MTPIKKTTTFGCLAIGIGLLLASPAWALVTDFTVATGTDENPIVVGYPVTFRAIDDGMGPLAVSWTWEIRSVDEGVIGEWQALGDGEAIQPIMTFAGDYEVQLTVSYMPDPCACNQPPTVTPPKQITVNPPDQVVLKDPPNGLNVDVMINVGTHVYFKVRAKGKPAVLDASAVAEERITRYDPQTGAVLKVGNWVTGPRFFLMGDTIDDVKTFRVVGDQAQAAWDNIAIGQTFVKVKQEIRVKYVRGGGKVITTETLGTFNIIEVKTGANTYQYRQVP